MLDVLNPNFERLFFCMQPYFTGKFRTKSRITFGKNFYSFSKLQILEKMGLLRLLHKRTEGKK